MKDTIKHKRKIISKIDTLIEDVTKPDTGADKTGTDSNADCTEKAGSINRFDKPKREADPDTTGKDINSDKTKKEKPQSRKSTK
jgi:hypothetical protein